MKGVKYELKWAILFIGMVLVWMGLERFLGLHEEYIEKHAVFTNFIIIPTIAMYFLAMRDKKKNFYNGSMSFGQGFRFGAIMTLIVALFSPVTQYITTFFITPEYFANIIDYSVDQGLMTRIKAQEYFNYESYAIQSTLGALFIGLLTSGILALILKNKKVSS